MLSDRMRTQPSSARREEGTIERTAAVTDEPHAVSETSLFSEDGCPLFESVWFRQ